MRRQRDPDLTAGLLPAIVLAAIAGGAGAFVLVATSDHTEAKAVWSIFGPAVGWSFVGTACTRGGNGPDSAATR